MLKIEKMFINKISENKEIIFLITISAIALLIRYTGRDFISHDMKMYLIKWYDYFKEGGGVYVTSR